MRQDFRVEPKVHIPVLQAPIKAVPVAPPVVQEPEAIATPISVPVPQALPPANDTIPNALVELPKKLKEPKPRFVRVPDAAGCEPQYAKEELSHEKE